MSGLLDLLHQHLDASTVSQMSAQLGAEPAQTQQALSAALPLLLGGLARNANRSPEEAQGLAQALDTDHTGGLLDQLGSLLGGSRGTGGLGGLLGGGSGGSGGGFGDLLGMAGDLLGGARQPSQRTVDGNGILGHVLGQRRGAVEQGVARASGLDTRQVSQLLGMLAPIVMGALGRAKQQHNLDAKGVADLLDRERAVVEEKTPGMKQGGLLGLLDTDRDGDIADDVAKIGSALGASGMLGKLFGEQ